MKTQGLFLVVLTAVFAGCNTLRSDLFVQPGKQFELGASTPGAASTATAEVRPGHAWLSGQPDAPKNKRHGPFQVQARNVGNASVVLSERRINGETVMLGTFAPGDQQTLRFAEGSALLVRNTSVQVARLNLVVTGDKNLSMEEKTP